MLSSKLIPIIVAAFCGLAMQFHVSAAQADLYTGTGFQLNPGWEWCTDDNYCLYMDYDTTAGVWDPNNNEIWRTTPTRATNYLSGCYIIFQNDGNLVVYVTYYGEPNIYPICAS